MQQRDTHRHLVLLVVEPSGCAPCPSPILKTHQLPFSPRHTICSSVLALNIGQLRSIRSYPEPAVIASSCRSSCCMFKDQRGQATVSSSPLQSAHEFARRREFRLRRLPCVARRTIRPCGRIERRVSYDLRKQRILSFAAAFLIRCVKVCGIDAVTLRVSGKQPQGRTAELLQSLLCFKRSDRIPVSI